MKNQLLLFLLSSLLSVTFVNAQDLTKVKAVTYNFINQANGDNIIYDESGALSDTVWNAKLLKGKNDDTALPGNMKVINGARACSKAMVLNGEDEWIEINKKYTRGPFDYDRNTFSISLWIKPESGTITSNTVLVQCGYGSELSMRFKFGYLEFACGLRNQDGSVKERKMERYHIDDKSKIVGHWTLVQISFDDGTIDGFLNGKRIVSFNMLSSTTMPGFVDGAGNIYNNINVGAQVGYSYALDQSLTDHSAAYLYKGAVGEIIINLNSISSSEASAKYDAENAVTEACAGQDETIGYGDVLTLDGSGSVSPYGDLNFSWQLNGEEVCNDTILKTDTLSIGEHTFTLKVSENVNHTSATDDVKVTVLPMHAVAGDDIVVNEGDTVVLDGSSSTSYNGTMNFSWQLNGEEVSKDTVLRTDTLSIGEHLFTLTVSDASSNSSSDNVMVTVKNVAAKAEAGREQTIKEDQPLILDAGSSTGYKTILYEWILNGSVVSDKEKFTMNGLSAGVYWFYLNITDSRGDADSDSVKVTIYPSVITTVLDFESLASNGVMFEDQGNLFDSIQPLEWIYDDKSTSKNSFGERLPEDMAQPTLTNGIEGKAMLFDGKKDWVLLQLPYAITKNRDNKYFAWEQKNFTVSVWFYDETTTVSPPKSPDQIIFELPGMALNLRTDTLYATAGIRDRSTPGSKLAGTCIKIPFRAIETWTNIIMVFEGGEESSNVRVYKNGVLFKEETINCTSLIPDEYAAGAIGGHYKYGVLDTYGKVSYVEEGDVDGYFKGKIDQFETFDKALSDNEAMAVYEKYTTTGISTKQYGEVSVYPNPTRGSVYIDLSNVNEQVNIEVYNLFGMAEKKMKIEHPASLYNFDISDLNDGIYIIKVISGDKISLGKVRLSK